LRAVLPDYNPQEVPVLRFRFGLTKPIWYSWHEPKP